MFVAVCQIQYNIVENVFNNKFGYSIDNVKCKHDRLFLSLPPPQKSIIMMWAWTETFQANYLESKHCNCKIVVVEVVILQQIVTDQVPEA